MNVTRFRHTGGEASSFQVESSGQYTTYIFPPAPTDSETRQIYKPERRPGFPILVVTSGEVINLAELLKCQGLESGHKFRSNIHCAVDDSY